MLGFAERFRDALVPFILGGTALLVLLLLVLVLQRGVRARRERSHAALVAHYTVLVDAALGDPAGLQARLDLERAPRAHAAVIGELVLAPLRVARGQLVDRAWSLASDLGLRQHWLSELRARKWWRRAEAALALGAIRDASSVQALVHALGDEHAQVRAAAVDALGSIGDPSVARTLLEQLADGEGHERARVIEALRAMGPPVTAALIAHAAAHPADRALAADVLAFVGGSAARGPLLEWAADADTLTRAAAWRALAHVGIDERSYYHALRALQDAAPAVRAAAARALGRSGRSDAVPHLAALLDDEWDVAAESGRALARAGTPGITALRERAAGAEGLGHDLARQLLWEGGHR